MTAVTVVCCSMISLIQTRYGSSRFRHGSSRPCFLYHDFNRRRSAGKSNCSASLLGIGHRGLQAVIDRHIISFPLFAAESANVSSHQAYKSLLRVQQTFRCLAAVSRVLPKMTDSQVVILSSCHLRAKPESFAHFWNRSTRTSNSPLFETPLKTTSGVTRCFIDNSRVFGS